MYSRWLALADSAPFEVRDCTVQYSTVVFRVRMNRKLLSYHLILSFNRANHSIQFHSISVQFFPSVLRCLCLGVRIRKEVEATFS